MKKLTIQGTKIFVPDNVSELWRSHAMAPAAVRLDKDTVRVFVGGWDSAGISRIFCFDVVADNPAKQVGLIDKPVLNIGEDGAFDENGVFPGHVAALDGKILLYYTGFQLGYKIRHFNFGGLATSTDGVRFERQSRAPVLDRSDEGLHVRAGQSIVPYGDGYLTCYSAGSEWEQVGGTKRPVYAVFAQVAKSWKTFDSRGKLIVPPVRSVEHGLGRPQVIEAVGGYFVFYTRRMLDMRYSFGAAASKDGTSWHRVDHLLDIIPSEAGFDDEMIYFPCLVNAGSHWLLFYSGNGFGKGGVGVVKLTDDDLLHLMKSVTGG